MNDNELLIRIDERVGTLIMDNIEFKSNLNSCKERIGNLESWKSKTLGFVISVPVIVPILIYLIFNI